MLNNIVFKKKEIYYFGKKEMHNVLCIEKVSDTGESYYVPLTYATKGVATDGSVKYYNTYIVNDHIDEIVIDNLPKIYENAKIDKDDKNLPF